MAEEGSQDPSGNPGEGTWHSGYDTETQGWLNNRGMDKLTASDALAAAIKGHRNAEASLGVPQERRIDLPVDIAIDGALDPIYNRLGRPEKSDEYKFDKATGEDADKPFDEWARAAFHKAGLSANNADALYSSFKDMIDSTVGDQAAEAKINSDASELDLKKEWGSTYERNKNLADVTAAKFGLDADALNAVKGALGANAAMKLFQAIGAGIGEDSFVNDTGLGPTGPTTPAGALEELATLQKDKGFIALYLAGDEQARKRMDNLHRLAAG